MPRLEVIYRGNVQGVGFRATARSIARRHTVTGWVQNETDGSVRLQVQGDPEEVRAFLHELSQTLAGNIKSRHEHPWPTDPAETTFEIRR
jgi:acylphosphatase